MTSATPEKKIINTITKVLNSGNYILGSETTKFEEEFAEYNNCKYGIGVGNGTDALTLSLRSIKMSTCKDFVRCAQKTLTPFEANKLAVAAPIPDEPPVTKATLFLKLVILQVSLH